MRERVSHILGKKPIILVCPHGADDTNTDIITEMAAKQLDCYAVINRGFERADFVDVDKDLADCNRVDHVKQDVVRDEYLNAITRFVQKITMKGARGMTMMWGVPYGYNVEMAHIFHVHGCGNGIHKEAGEPVELVIGYGLGTKKDNLTCEPWRKSLFVDLWKHYAVNGAVYVGKGGGKYAGRDSNNMNQYFRKHIFDQNVQSMQLEFPYSARDSESQAVTTAMQLALVLSDYLRGQDQEYEKDSDDNLI